MLAQTDDLGAARRSSSCYLDSVANELRIEYSLTLYECSFDSIRARHHGPTSPHPALEAGACVQGDGLCSSETYRTMSVGLAATCKREDLDRVIANPYRRVDSYDFDKMESHLGTFTLARYKPQRPNQVQRMRNAITYPEPEVLQEAAPPLRESLGPYQRGAMAAQTLDSGPSGGIERQGGTKSSFDVLPPGMTGAFEDRATKLARGAERIIPAPSPAKIGSRLEHDSMGLNAKTLPAEFMQRAGRTFMTLKDVDRAEREKKARAARARADAEAQARVRAVAGSGAALAGDEDVSGAVGALARADAAILGAATACCRSLRHQT